MSEQFEHNPNDHEDPVAGSTWLVGLVGTILLVVIILGVTALLYQVQDEEILEQVVKTAPAELVELRAAQQRQLTDPPRYEERPGAAEGDAPVRSLVIPIDRAMRLIAQEHGGT
jgi:hypothetical protein